MTGWPIASRDSNVSSKPPGGSGPRVVARTVWPPAKRQRKRGSEGRAGALEALRRRDVSSVGWVKPQAAQRLSVTHAAPVDVVPSRPDRATFTPSCVRQPTPSEGKVARSRNGQTPSSQAAWVTPGRCAAQDSTHPTSVTNPATPAPNAPPRPPRPCSLRISARGQTVRVSGSQRTAPPAALSCPA